MTQKNQEAEGQGLTAQGREFLRGVRAEAEKVTWPPWKETRSATAVVLVFVTISAGFLGGVDFLLSKLIEWMVR